MPRDVAAQQIPLIIDSLNDAIRDTARLIGTKRIAKELWPEKSEEAAARYLNDCLDPDRAQKLDGEQILFVARRGRELSCHLIAAYINADLGYAPPLPVDAEDTKAELQRAYIESVKEQRRIAERLERLGGR